MPQVLIGLLIAVIGNAVLLGAVLLIMAAPGWAFVPLILLLVLGLALLANKAAEPWLEWTKRKR